MRRTSGNELYLALARAGFGPVAVDAHYTLRSMESIERNAQREREREMMTDGSKIFSR